MFPRCIGCDRLIWPWQHYTVLTARRPVYLHAACSYDTQDPNRLDGWNLRWLEGQKRR